MKKDEQAGAAKGADALTEDSASGKMESIELLIKSSTTCMERKDYAGSLEFGRRILALVPEDVTGAHIVGLSLLRLGETIEAQSLLERARLAKPENGLLHWQTGQAQMANGRHAEALVSLDTAMRLGVADPLLNQHAYDVASALFKEGTDWQVYDRVQRIMRQGVLESGRWVVGESTLASPYFSNMLLLQATRNHARHVMTGVGQAPTKSFKSPEGKVRLGFVGCDFFEQATAYLMVAFIEAIDRQGFEVFAYDHGPERPETPFRQRVVKAYDHFIDIGDLDDESAAERITEDRIDILFSIKNPASARLGVFARRPAPVQVHYLYYPGTSGMPFFDYIIGDEVVIPPGMESGYSERVVRLDGCYQPNDPHRVLARDTPRSKWGNPEGAVVLANFSQAYKYTPNMFDLWCLLLKADSRRILWLLCNKPELQARLRDEAGRRGIDPARLFFTDHVQTQEHLDRLRHADLILDTFPYGGHTLTSDALWAGTPVVTLCGETFASRVAASLLTSVSLTELIAYTEQGYIDVAERLLTAPHLLRQCRRHLDEGRSRFALFDAGLYARRFERAMWSLVGQ